MSNFVIHIKRYDPSVDKEPYVATYEIPDAVESQPMTALKALHWIHRYVEPIAYDFNCRRGSCGRCAMMIDGIPRLACYFELVDEHTLEPLFGGEVIRDLIVDTSQWMDCFVRSANEVKGDSTDIKPMSSDYWRDTIYPINACRECMCCYSACSVVKKQGVSNYLGPGAFQQIFLRHIDDGDKGNRIAQAAEAHVFECTQCGLCTLVCPSRINCAENILTLIKAAKAAGF